MSKKKPSRYYTCRGSIRGECPTYHRTLDGAAACIERDRAGCAAQGGYSDRSVVYVCVDHEERLIELTDGDPGAWVTEDEMRAG